MNRSRVEWSGLRELTEALRQLPDDLTDEARGIVDRRSASAEARVKANYQAHHHTGKLADSVERTVLQVGAFGVGVRVRAKARHAHLFENGTAARHDSQGAYRGVMLPAPPMHQFVPVMEDERRAMYEDLRDVLRRAGLQVDGHE